MTKNQQLRRLYTQLANIVNNDELTEQEYADLHTAMRHIDYVLWPSIKRDERDS